MTPAQLVTQVLSIPTHERARIVEACAVLAPYLAMVEALGGVEAAAAALSVETPTISGRPCDRCGAVIEGRDNRTKFCEDCSREMKRERGLRSNRARDERVMQRQGRQAAGAPATEVPPSPEPVRHRWCARCATLIDHRPGRAIYCEECSKTRFQDRPTQAQAKVMKASSAARDALLVLKVAP